MEKPGGSVLEPTFHGGCRLLLATRPWALVFSGGIQLSSEPTLLLVRWRHPSSWVAHLRATGPRASQACPGWLRLRLGQCSGWPVHFQASKTNYWRKHVYGEKQTSDFESLLNQILNHIEVQTIADCLEETLCSFSLSCGENFPLVFPHTLLIL